MKKTLIALMALSGLALGEVDFDVKDIVAYDATFTDGATTKTNTKAAIKFGTADPALSSWVFEFTTTNPGGGPNKAIFTTSMDGNNPNGLTVVAWNNNASARAFGLGLRKSDGSYNTFTKSLTHDFNSSSTVTMRMAYDATNDVAYLYNVTDERWVEVANVSNSLAEGTSTDVLKLTSGASYMGAFGETMSLGKVYDLTKVATSAEGGAAAFKKFITNPVPEPATATLSLLALAGLASRRRRH